MGTSSKRTKRNLQKRSVSTTSDVKTEPAPAAIEPVASTVAADDDDGAVVFLGRMDCAHTAKAVNVPLLKRVLPLSAAAARCQGCTDAALQETATSAEGTEEMNDDLWVCLACGLVSCGRSSAGQHAVRHHKAEPAHSLVLHPLRGMVWCYACDDELSPDSDVQLKDVMNLLEKDTAPIATKTTTAVEAAPTQAEPPVAVAEEPVTEGKKAASTTLKTKKTQGAIKAEKKKTKKEQQKEDEEKRKAQQDLERESEMAAAVSAGHNLKLNGLQNLGNTCFFNSVLQALGQTDELQAMLKVVVNNNEIDLAQRLENLSIAADDAQKDGEQHLVKMLEAASKEAVGQLTTELHKLLRQMRPGTQQTTLNPREVLDQVRKKAPRFQGYRQQDSHELLRYLLDGMRTEELRRRSDYLEKNDLKNDQALKQYPTFVDTVFGGKLVSRIVCHSCCTVSNTEEPFLDLSLSIPVPKTAPAVSSGYPKRDKADKKQSPAVSDTKETTKPVPPPPVAANFEEVVDREMATQKNWPSAWSQLRLGVTRTVEECFAEFCNKEVLQGGESFICVECGKRSLAASGSSSSKSLTSSIARAFKKAPAKETPEVVSDVEAAEQEEAPVAAVGEEENEAEGGDNGEATSPATSPTLEAPAADPAAPPAEPAADAAEPKKKTFFGNLFGRKTKSDSASSSASSSPSLAAISTVDAPTVKIPTVYTSATKRFLIKQTPQILTLHINRFTQAGFSLRKNGDHVAFKFELDIAPFCVPEVSEAETTYDLFAIVEHSGSMSGGHYICNVRPAKNDSNGWFHISDSHVSSMSERMVTSTQAYLLFYRRRNGDI